MIITFIVPPSLDGENPAERTAGCTRLVYPMPNIYELIVAALLEQGGYTVRYEDFVIKDNSATRFENFIKSDQSDCYMIWSVNLSLETDKKAIEIIRKYYPNKRIVIMGPGVTYYTAKLLLDDNVFVIRGEPEYTVKELIDNWDAVDFSSIKGLSYLKQGNINHNPSRPLIENLDDLPFPARHFIESHAYTNPKLKTHPYTTVLTSRNCPYKCIYCVPSSLTFAREIEYRRENGKKPKVSARSVENVIQELEMLIAQGYKAIAFIDDNFITTAKRLRPICEILKKHNIVWGCQARADAITEEIGSILKESNCQFVDIGGESFNDDILRYIKKGVNSEQILEGLDILKKNDIPVKLNILIGTSPLETEDTVKDTYRKAIELGVSQVMFNIVAPFPGTVFYDIAKENNWIIGGDYSPTDVQHHSILSYPNLSNRQMEKLLFKNNIKFFLRPSFIMMHISKFNSFYDFFIACKALKRKLFH